MDRTDGRLTVRRPAGVDTAPPLFNRSRRSGYHREHGSPQADRARPAINVGKEN